MKKKTCRDCKKEKDLQTEFYAHKGFYRSECKKCTIKRTSLYKKTHPSPKPSPDEAEKRRRYHIDYYQKNKEKFVIYRQNFHKKNPEYRKNYERAVREAKRGELYER